MMRLDLLFVLSFGSGVIDLSLGMEFGFTITPLMLMLGYTPSVAVPSARLTKGLDCLWFHLNQQSE